jgi:biopolymer transport protein ExbD
MISSLRARGSRHGKPEIQVIPLIDILFTLIVFLLVSISFTETAVIEVDRPQASSGAKGPADSLTVVVRKDERIFLGKDEVQPAGLRHRLEQERRRKPNLAVVLAADQAASARALVRVMDECKIAGVRNVYVATREK